MEFKANTIDTNKPAAVAPPPTPAVNQRFMYAPTMVGIKNFDQKYKLPKQKKVPKSKKTVEEIQLEKEKLEEQLAENDEKM